MIARVRNYSTTVTSPAIGEHDAEAEYVPLVEKVCGNYHDVEDLVQQLHLVCRGGVKPLVTIFEPRRANGR